LLKEKKRKKKEIHKIVTDFETIVHFLSEWLQKKVEIYDHIDARSRVLHAYAE